MRTSCLLVLAACSSPGASSSFVDRPCEVVYVSPAGTRGPFACGTYDPDAATIGCFYSFTKYVWCCVEPLSSANQECNLGDP